MKEKLTFAKDISPDTTLEDLKLTKEGWINQARENGYPDVIWTIVRWLGKPDVRRHGTKGLVFELGNIKIYGNEGVERYGVREEAYISSRKIHVWIDDDHYVMCWVWEVTPDGNKAEDIERSLFVPGAWLEKLLVRVGPAQAAEAAYNASLTDDERQRLMKQLLIGVSL